ncbi:MAG: hypothetical protein JW863_14040 [Chitinispirillaceae bacterium]|nr:hypothetical protein [Chitinispirillaceae bacterium]
MKIRVVWFSALVTGSFIVLIGCGGGSDIASVETSMEGNCTGRIVDTDGTPVSGAEVLLVPEEYTPGLTEESAQAIFSTTSNASGQYGFEVATSGKYNLLSNNTREYVLRKEIAVEADATIELPDEQLLEPGSLSGTVELEGMTNYKSAVILLPGTNTFTSPADSSGAFTIPALAQGTYQLKVLTLETGFTVAETTVVIESCKNTVLSTIVLYRKKVPSINNFTVDYDPLMMEATLSWTTENSEFIDSFAIYRNREMNFTPVMKTGSDVRTAHFDHVTTLSDTFCYSIAIIGKDGWEEPAVSGEPFVCTGAFTAIEIPTTFSAFPAASVDPTNPPAVYFTKDRFYLFEGNGIPQGRSGCRITKYGPDVTVVKQVEFDAYRVKGATTIAQDVEENVYVLVIEKTDASSTSTYIYKFDRDLTLTGRHEIVEAPNNSISVSSTGNMLHYATWGINRFEPKDEDSTRVTVLDANFTIISETVYRDFRTIEESCIHDNTVTAIISCKLWDQKQGVRFDDSFNKISDEPLPGDMTVPVPPGYSKPENSGVHLCSENLFVDWYTNTTVWYPQPDVFPPHTILYLFDGNNEVIARHPIEDLVSNTLSFAGFKEKKLYFDGNGNFFDFGENKAVRYTLELPADTRE